ncbi:hypothetical protein F2P79_008875 [Pimephales promelas]|nr:hypothetical protein F2P79_008875 [Pimephales promelas]
MASAALIFGRHPAIHPSSPSPSRLSSLFFTARVYVWNARAQPRSCDWRTEAACVCDWRIESGLISLRARVECSLYTEAQLQRKERKKLEKNVYETRRKSHHRESASSKRYSEEFVALP